MVLPKAVEWVASRVARMVDSSVALMAFVLDKTRVALKVRTRVGQMA